MVAWGWVSPPPMKRARTTCYISLASVCSTIVLGCGRAGGDWSQEEAAVEKITAKGFGEGRRLGGLFFCFGF